MRKVSVEIKDEGRLVEIFDSLDADLLVKMEHVNAKDGKIGVHYIVSRAETDEIGDTMIAQGWNNFYDMLGIAVGEALGIPWHPRRDKPDFSEVGA